MTWYGAVCGSERMWAAALRNLRPQAKGGRLSFLRHFRYQSSGAAGRPKETDEAQHEGRFEAMGELLVDRRWSKRVGLGPKDL